MKDDYGKLYRISADTDRDLLTGRPSAPTSQHPGDGPEPQPEAGSLLLDCCHSGALAEGVRAADASAGALEAFTGRGTGKVIITASDSYEFAWERGETPAGFENSLFTHFLVDGLRTGKADVNGDGIVTLDELYKYVHQKVVEKTSSKTPQWKLAGAAGDIEIARNPAPSTPLPRELADMLNNRSHNIGNYLLPISRELLKGIIWACGERPSRPLNSYPTTKIVASGSLESRR